MIENMQKGASFFRPDYWKDFFGRFFKDSYNKYLVIILGVAFLLRLIHISTIYHSPNSDAYVYWAMATGKIDIFTTTASGYPFFLRLLMAISSPNSYFFFRFANVILSTLTIVFVMASARRLFNQRSALIAGVIMALYRPLILYCAMMLTETFTAFLLSLIVYCLAHLYKKLTLWPLPCLILTTVCLLHVRPNSATLLPLFLLVSLFAGNTRKEKLWNCLRMLGVCSLILLLTIPVSYQVSQKERRTSFIAPTDRLNLLIGHNVLADGSWINTNLLSPDQKDPLKFMEEYYAQELFSLPFKKFEVLFKTRVFPWFDDNDYYETPLGNKLYFYLLQSKDLWLFSLIGFVIALGWNRKAAFILMFGILLYLVIFFIFFADSRFRLPVDFLFIIFTSVLLAKLEFLWDKPVVKILIIVYAIFGLWITAANFVRFSGPNLFFEGENSTVGDIRFDTKTGMDLKYISPSLPEVFTGKSSKKNPAILEKTVSVDPGVNAYLVFSFKCSCDSQTYNREQGIRYQIIVIRHDGEWLYPPIESVYYVINGKRDRWVDVWRRFYLPSTTGTVKIKIVSDLDGEFEIKDISLRGMGG